MNHASKAFAFPSDASPLGLKDAILIVCNPFGFNEVGIAGGLGGDGGGVGGGGVWTSLLWTDVPVSMLAWTCSPSLLNPPSPLTRGACPLGRLPIVVHVFTSSSSSDIGSILLDFLVFLGSKLRMSPTGNFAGRGTSGTVTLVESGWILEFGRVAVLVGMPGLCGALLN